jgi:E3 ubiquitin-protein ligase CCNP1IP1
MSAYGDIYCNFRQCHKLLNDGYAWITSCYHIYCSEDGEKYFSQTNICPTCSKELDSKIDLIRIRLRPTEPYKNLILCGQNPNTIMEICLNGFKFWTNQLKQENDYTQYLLEREREKRLSSETNEASYEYRLKQMQKLVDELKKENELLKQQHQNNIQPFL